MKSMLFTFTFENFREVFCRKYTFKMIFKDDAEVEQALDWAEKTDDVVKFINKMNVYGTHVVNFDPTVEFYGFCSDEIPLEKYIRVITSWRDFFVRHKINCEDIVEVIHDKNIL